MAGRRDGRLTGRYVDRRRWNFHGAIWGRRGKEREGRIVGRELRLKRTDGKWKVYDAIVENISIVNNYRSQFDRVISKSSYEELKKMLREKAGQG